MKKLCYFLAVLFVLSPVSLCSTLQALTFDFEKNDQINSWVDLAGTTEIRDGYLCSVKDAGGPLVSMIEDWKDEWSDYTLSV